MRCWWALLHPWFYWRTGSNPLPLPWCWVSLWCCRIWWVGGPENCPQCLFVASLICLIRQHGEPFATRTVLLVNCQVRMNALEDANP